MGLDFVTTEPQRAYMEWWFGVLDSIGGMFTRCKESTAPICERNFETFRSNSITLIDYESRNATFASNSIGNFRLEKFRLTVTARSQFDEVSFPNLSQRSTSTRISSRPTHCCSKAG